MDREQIKSKVMEKLPAILPGLVKSVIVHIVMVIYHVSMPPWVTAIKIKKAVSSHKNGSVESENRDRMERRMMKRNRRKKRRNSLMR